jgi:hypothetical protein
MHELILITMKQHEHKNILNILKIMTKYWIIKELKYIG